MHKKLTCEECKLIHDMIVHAIDFQDYTKEERLENSKYSKECLAKLEKLGFDSEEITYLLFGD